MKALPNRHQRRAGLSDPPGFHHSIPQLHPLGDGSFVLDHLIFEEGLAKFDYQPEILDIESGCEPDQPVNISFAASSLVMRLPLDVCIFVDSSLAGQPLSDESAGN